MRDSDREDTWQLKSKTATRETDITMERQAANNLRIHVLGKMFVDLTFTIVIPEFYSST